MPIIDPDQGVPLPAGPDLADNPAAFLNFYTPVKSRLILRYTNAANRAALHAVPILNETSILDTSQWYDRWTGSKWLPATPIQAYKTASQTVNNSTALVDDAELFVTPPLINTNYAIEAYVAYNSTTVADIKFDFTFAGTTTSSTFAGPAGATTIAAGGIGDGNWDASSFGTVLQVGGANGAAGALITGGLRVGATTGLLRLRWAQNTLEATNTQVLDTSWLRITAVS